MRGAALVAALVVLAPAAATAVPPLRITALRVLQADGRTPAPQPLRRGHRYVYRLDYRVGGRTEVRIRRAGTLISPYGDHLVEIRPPASLADPGRLYASGPIIIRRADSPGDYVLRYVVSARDRTGVTRRTREVRLRFR